MRVIKISVSKHAVKELDLGVAGENNVTQVQFDISPWIEDFGNGEVTLLNQRSVDASPYIVPIAVEDGSVIWTISATDSARSGVGNCMLIYTADSSVKKSVVYKTFLASSLSECSNADDCSSCLDTIIRFIPTPTASDAGKILAVDDNGKYVLKSINDFL